MQSLPKTLISSITALVVFTAFASSALAATFVSDELAKISQPVTDDLFVAGQNINIDQAVSEDFYGAGRSVRVTADIGQDVHAVGQFVEISGQAGEDVLAAGNNVTITGAVGGDVFAAGADVTIHPQGAIGQSVWAAGENITLSGVIHGNVHVAGNTITLAADTVIDGDLISRGSLPPVLQDGAIVKGTTRHIQETFQERQGASNGLLIGWAGSVIGLFVGAWLLVFIFPTLIGGSVLIARRQTGRSLAIGALGLVAFVPTAIILMITGLGVSLGLLVLLAGSACLILASLIAVVFLGAFLSGILSTHIDTGAAAQIIRLGWAQILLGAVVYAVLNALGPLGWIITFILTIISLGGLWQTLWAMFRPQAPVTTVKP